MKNTADIIARKLLEYKMPKVVNLDSYRSEVEFLSANNLGPTALDDMVSQGCDVSHAAYVFTINFTSVLSEQMASLKEAKKLFKILNDATVEYIPQGPPISPLTNSYFSLWACFDLVFGGGQVTIGNCALAFAEKAKSGRWLCDTLLFLSVSRMGFYVHCGKDGDFVKLREIGTQEILYCHVPVDYKGKKGELWFVRLAPAVFSHDKYFVVLTTPYIVLGYSESDYLSSFQREFERAKLSVKKLDKETFLNDYYKFGSNRMHWNEYIFCAYTSHTKDAIFLTGVPDLKETLPHA